MPPIIRVENLSFSYNAKSERPVSALSGVNLTIERGEYVVILGHNGSGKSTLAKHLNALLWPTQGDVWVKEWNTRDVKRTLDIRRTVGMVFQHPDNQIVATVVEEDIAFGPENLGVPRDELLRRVDWSLDQVEMQAFRTRAPHQLSGGQKQRICIAGVLAMQPEVLVLDESTAMLDPLGRNEVLAITHRLNREQGVTVVAVTHFMREAIDADRLIIMSDGKIVMDGPPRLIFQERERLRQLQLDVPHVSSLAAELHARFPAFPGNLLTVGEIVEEVKKWDKKQEASRKGLEEKNELPIANSQWARGNEGEGGKAELRDTGSATRDTQHAARDPLITMEHLAHYYMRGTPLEVKAIEDISMDIRRGEIIGILGHTGSGKSTAIQHLNVLLRPDEGTVTIFGDNAADPKLDLRSIRRRVGLVFQLPEAQLFEQYVGDDVAYGPRKLNLSREEVRERVRKAMEAVGLGFEAYKDRPTFGLSGGQMRRVALAGVLALEPEVLVLDEPTAGLDPQARRQLMDHILQLHRNGVTLVMVSHNMEEMAEICDWLFVLAEGRTVMEGTPATIFGQPAQLRELGLDIPDVTQVADELVTASLLPETTSVCTLQQAVETVGALLQQLEGLSDHTDGADN